MASLNPRHNFAHGNRRCDAQKRPRLQVAAPILEEATMTGAVLQPELIELMRSRFGGSYGNASQSQANINCQS
jgi:hypothetical protein